jgi:hypothetical protein
MGGMVDPLVHARLIRSIFKYREGVYCSGELWRDISALLKGQNIAEAMDELPADLQAVLRWCYKDRTTAEEDKAYEEFKQWCSRGQKMIS